MTQVRLLKPLTIGNRKVPKGGVVDVDEISPAVAADLVERKQAERVTADKPVPVQEKRNA